MTIVRLSKILAETFDVTEDVAKENMLKVVDRIMLELSSMNTVQVLQLGTFLPIMQEDRERFIPSKGCRAIIPANIRTRFSINTKFKSRLSKLRLKNVKMD